MLKFHDMKFSENTVKSSGEVMSTGQEKIASKEVGQTFKAWSSSDLTSTNFSRKSFGSTFILPCIASQCLVTNGYIEICSVMSYPAACISPVGLEGPYPFANAVLLIR